MYRVKKFIGKDLSVIATLTVAVLILVNQFAILMKFHNSREELIILELVFGFFSVLVFSAAYRFIVKPAFKELQTDNRKLQQKIREKDRMIATVVHDLRNPLMGIKGMAGLLKEDLEDHIGNKQEKVFKAIHEAHHKADSLIQELLELSLIENEKTLLKTELTPIEEYLGNVISQFSHLAKEKGVNLEVEVKDGLNVSLDRTKFSRVIDNLISNALKFTAGPGEVKVVSYEEEGNVVIKVQDSGIGIPADMQERIFDQFTTARRLGVKGEKSTGLGMSIAKKIVEMHKGKIRVESGENLGTSFYISLPA